MDEKNQTQENLEEISAVQPEPAPAPDPDPNPAPDPKPGKKPSVFRGNKFKRGGMATVMTVVFIAIVVVVNVLVSLLTERFPSMNIDLTAQGMNTLSDQAVKIAESVEQETTIYLIGTEDAYREDRILSNYGLKYSQVANLAERLGEVNGKIKTQFIDPDTNPSFINSYPDESLVRGRVLVRTEKRYKVLTVDDMFSMSQNSSTGATETYSNVDSALAGALELVNMDKVPVLTIATGHGEMLTSSDMSSFLDMIKKLNFEVREVDFMTEDIPADTQLLMLPTPTTDYTDVELDKIRALLADEERQESIAVLVTCYPSQSELPKLNGFLEEWGVSVAAGQVVAETDSSRYALANPSLVFVDNNEDVLEDNGYSRLVSPMSVPLTLLFTGNGDVGTRALWTTSDKAYAIAAEDMAEEAGDPDLSQQTVATLSSALTQFGNDFYYRSVIVFGSTYVFTDTFMVNAYGDRNYVSDLLRYATDTDGSEVTVLPARVQTNTLDVTASQNTITVLGLGVFTVGLPVLILAAGLVIFLKRRHL